MPARSGAVESRPPLHGYRGDAPSGRFASPRGLTVAISREAGARGATIARKVGEVLGWQVFDQEVLDYLMIDETGRSQLLSELPDGAREWVEEHLATLLQDRRVNADPDTVALSRLVLTVAARGDVVLVGRGAGFFLPPESTLHVRILAPFEDRVSYLAQSQRLSREEATREVRARDDRRAQFLAHAVFRDPADPTRYDLLVNSSRLGVESTAQVIGWALRTKQQFTELTEPLDGGGGS
jgi:cytidylate kinase